MIWSFVIESYLWGLNAYFSISRCSFSSCLNFRRLQLILPRFSHSFFRPSLIPLTHFIMFMSGLPCWLVSVILELPTYFLSCASLKTLSVMALSVRASSNSSSRKSWVSRSWFVSVNPKTLSVLGCESTSLIFLYKSRTHMKSFSSKCSLIWCIRF